MKQQFEEYEMPYSILEQYGLTQEMVEDLPEDVLEDLLAGQRSPVLPVHMTDDNGEDVHSRTRFMLMRKEDNNVDVVFHPVLEECDLAVFDDAQKAKLQGGKAIIADYQMKDGNVVKAFVQLDPETRQVLAVPTPVIGRNLQYLSDELHLMGAELQRLQNGDVLTVAEDDNPMSLGIDLNHCTGIRFAAGDEQTWKREAKREWDKYTFGAFGCWVMDNSGNLDYVSEEDYTEELWNEQKKRINANANVNANRR